MIVDTSALVALFDGGDRAHASVSAVVDATTEPLVVPPYVIAELDDLITSRLGLGPELAMLEEIGGGAWDLPSFDAGAIRDARSVIERYADQALGLADASIVVLARRFGTRTILTLDHRHFDVVRPLTGGRFRILP